MPMDVKQIVDNIQVVVKNVHIQHMDKTTDPEVFICGPVLIDRFSWASTSYDALKSWFKIS